MALQPWMHMPSPRAHHSFSHTCLTPALPHPQPSKSSRSLPTHGSAFGICVRYASWKIQTGIRSAPTLRVHNPWGSLQSEMKASLSDCVFFLPHLWRNSSGLISRWHLQQHYTCPPFTSHRLYLSGPIVYGHLPHAHWVSPMTTHSLSKWTRMRKTTHAQTHNNILLCV